MTFPKPVKRIKAKKRINRVKKTPLSKLMKNLDSAVSKFVIARDQKCVTCGSTEKLTCGHLITRGKKSIRWDLVNCNAQCWGCNYKHEFYPEVYFIWFAKHYGTDELEALIVRGYLIKKWNRTELESELAKYVS